MKRIIWVSGLLLISLCGISQIRYAKKIEVGYLNFRYTTINYDMLPGAPYDPVKLNNQQNGIDINVINGISFKEKLFAGVGVGYLNFEGISGVGVFADLQYTPFKWKLSPYVNSKFGYSHIWNQYPNGAGSGIVELDAGLRFKVSDKLSIYAQSGIYYSQDSFLIPIRLGVMF